MNSIKLKLIGWWSWVARRPLVLINLSFLIVILGLFIFLMNKPLDVLQNWQLTITDVKTYANGKPVFNPGDTLVFNSSSVKLADAKGTTTRTIVCEATGDRKAREIQLDLIPATRPSGVNPPRDNAVVIPDVTQFDGLPRECYLHFAVCYEDVILWRDHCEENQTEVFVVEEAVLDPASIRQQIEDLRAKIEALQASENANPAAPSSSNSNTSRVITPAPVTNNSTTNNSTTNNTTTPPAPEEDTGLVGGILKFVTGLF